MESVTAVEKAIQQFNSSELQTFRKWFTEFDQTLWDEELLDDQLHPTPLSGLMEQALNEHKAGRSKPL
jgi:hypothetical protein